MPAEAGTQDTFQRGCRYRASTGRHPNCKRTPASKWPGPPPARGWRQLFARSLHQRHTGVVSKTRLRHDGGHL